MKKILSMFFVLAIVVMGIPNMNIEAAVPTERADARAPSDPIYTSGDWKYQLDSSSGTAEAILYRYNGTESTVKTPDMLDGYAVTAIGDYVFVGNRLEKLIIGEGIQALGYSMFSACPNLTSVEIPYTIQSIGSDMNYNGAIIALSCEKFTKITVDEKNANYSSDEQGILYNKDKTILLNCPSGKKESVIIPSTVTKIEHEAFRTCANLTSIEIPETVKRIGYEGFANCKALTDVSLKSGLEELYKGVFSECPSLTSLTIPSSVKTIDNQIVDYSTNLESITVVPDNPYFSSDDQGLLYNKAKTMLKTCPSGKKGPVTIPDSVKRINAGAFVGNSNLISINIPASVDMIYENAFTYCENLTELVFNNPNAEIYNQRYIIGLYNNYDGLTVYGYPSSTAEKFTDDNKIAFKPIGDPITLTLRKDEKAIPDASVTNELLDTTVKTNEDGLVYFDIDDYNSETVYKHLIQIDYNIYSYLLKGSPTARIDFKTVKIKVNKGDKPAEGAFVSIDTHSIPVVKTDKDGIAHIILPVDESTNEITVESDGEIGKINMSMDDLDDDGMFFIDIEDSSVKRKTITGRILHNSEGISDVVLTAKKEGANLLYASTKANGSYRFILPDDSDGAYTINVIDDGGYDKGVLYDKQLTAEPGDCDNDFVFDDGITLEGTVTNALGETLPEQEVTDTGELSPTVKLYLEKDNIIWSAETTAGGKYQFDALYAGEYKISYGISNSEYTQNETIVLTDDMTKDIVLTSYDVSVPRNIQYDISLKSSIEIGELEVVSVRCQNLDDIKYEDLILEVEIPDGVLIEKNMLEPGQIYEDQKVSMKVDLDRVGALSGTDFVNFRFMFRLAEGYTKNKVVFSAFAREDSDTLLPYRDFIGVCHTDVFKPSLNGDACVTAEFVQSNEYKLNGQSMKDSDVKIFRLDTGVEVADFHTVGFYSDIGTLLSPTAGTYPFLAECTKEGNTQSSNVHVAEVLEGMEMSSIQLTGATIDGKTQEGKNPFVTSSRLLHSNVSIETTFNGLKEDDVVLYKLSGVKSSYTADDMLKANFTLAETGTKDISVVVMRNDETVFNKRIGQVTAIIDPSGYVYDKHTQKRIEGAVVTCHVLNSQSEWEVWDAQSHGQVNPLITDSDGRYAWDVPEGVYKVTVEKADYKFYDTIEDEKYIFGPGNSSIVIPPPRLDINMGIENIAKPEIVDSLPISDAVISPKDVLSCEFNKAMNADTLTPTNIILTKGEIEIPIQISINKAQNIISILPDAELHNGNYKLYFSNAIEDYNTEQTIDETNIHFTVSNEVESVSEAFRIMKHATEIDVNNPIHITFNEAVGSIEENDVQLLTNKNTTVDISLALNKDKTQLTIYPKSPLDSFADYTVKLLKGIESASGLCLAEQSITIQTFEEIKVPKANIESQAVEKGTQIILSCETDGADIYYTTDNSEPTLSSNVYAEPITITENVTIKAKAVKRGIFSKTAVFSYTILAENMESYKITYELNGGTNSPANPAAYTAETEIILQDAQKSGYTFKGWYKDNKYSEKIGKIELGTKGDLTLYAKWERIVEHVSTNQVTFHANGGTKLSKHRQTVTYGAKYGVLPTVVRKNYTFKGWYTKKSGGTKITKDTVVSSKNDHTLYARWTKVSKPKTPKISSVRNVKSKRAKIKIKKVSSADGYQIMYSTNKKFKSSKKIRTTSLNSTLKKLKKGKTYHIKVCAYKLDSTNKKIYGKYSKVKKIKITK